MNKWKIYFTWIILAAVPGNVFSILCSRYPTNTMTPKAPVDDNFAISITGNAQTYLLGQSYNISLQAYNGRRFIAAKLALENDNGDIAFNSNLGYLEVTDPVESRYSTDCVNMVETTNTNPKTRLDMVWTAPTEPGFGCVLIRATVIQHRDVWFMDDGSLTKRICEESVDDLESQKKDEEEKECCACDEARYEITFEGIWSRNLHPKDFPAKGWLTKFSDILGASHTSDYRFWDSGELASDAMKEFSEHGSSRSLEQELNSYFKEKKVRTILKARGPSFPYMNNPTLAWIRVDPARHQMSLASKIIPSPDWIVGVAGLELCLPNCTWIEEKVISLYPWDIGTDAGPSYTSADQPQLPPDVIRRMRSDFPADPRSPFYDPSGAPMKPMASLTIKRQRLYERKCTDEDSNNGEDVPRECQTHPWTPWSECSADCGTGVRSRFRVYKQQEVAAIYNCDEIMERRQVEICTGSCSNAENSPYPSADKEGDSLLESLRPMMKQGRTSEDCSGQWTAWSSCNVTCGAGYKMRRLILDKKNQGDCEEEDMFELEKCFIGSSSCHKYNKSPTVIGDTGYDENNENVQENVVDEMGGGTDNEFTNYGSDVTDSGLNRFRSQFQLYTNIDSNDNEFNYPKPEADYNIPAENLRQVQSYDNYNSRQFQNSYENRNFQYLRAQGNQVILDRKPKATYQTRFQGDYTLYEDSLNQLQAIPIHCYQPLSIVTCSDTRVVGNSWFYNFCTDECMLYASDICDPNTNKFSSMEKCEQHCGIPMRRAANFLRRKQIESPYCQRILRNNRARGYVY